MRRRDEDLKINSDCIRKEGKMSYRLVRKQNSEQIVESAVESLDVARHHRGRKTETQPLGARRNGGTPYGEGFYAIAREQPARKLHRLMWVADNKRLNVRGRNGMFAVFLQNVAQLNAEALQMLSTVILLNEIAESETRPGHTHRR